MLSEVKTTYPLRTETRERNRNALLAAAAELAAEHGYARTSVNAVATRAGLTSGAVYSIFGSKSALFAALMEPRLAAYALSAVATPGVPVREALTAVARFWAAHAAHPDARAALLMGLEIGVEALRSGQVSEQMRAANRSVITRFAEELEHVARVAGEELPRPAREIATTVLASMQGLAQLHVLGVAEVEEHLFVAAALNALA